MPWGLREHFTPASFRINFYPYDLTSEIHRNDRVRRLMQREFVNPDHVSWFSWHTLRTLLGNHGWTIVDVAYYRFPRVPVPHSASRGERARTRAFNSYQRVAKPLFRLRPTLADGIILVAGFKPQPS